MIVRALLLYEDDGEQDECEDLKEEEGPSNRLLNRFPGQRQLPPTVVNQGYERCTKRRWKCGKREASIYLIGRNKQSTCHDEPRHPELSVSDLVEQ